MKNKDPKPKKGMPPKKKVKGTPRKGKK